MRADATQSVALSQRAAVVTDWGGDGAVHGLDTKVLVHH
jgi:hypothetical protein